MVRALIRLYKLYKTIRVRGVIQDLGFGVWCVFDLVLCHLGVGY